MAQKVTALLALREDWSSLPSTYVEADNYVYLQFQRTQCSLLTYVDSCSHAAHINSHKIIGMYITF